jgi:hypothetical protein
MSGPSVSGRLVGEAMLRHPLVRELLAARSICVLATLDPQHAIHAVPMWFAPDGDAVLLATGSRSRKVANLESDARATLVLHDSRPGFEVCGVSMSGRVDVLRGPHALPAIARVHDRYVVHDTQAGEHVRDFLASDDAALRFRPDSAWTWDERESPASDALRALGGALPLVPTEPR